MAARGEKRRRPETDRVSLVVTFPFSLSFRFFSLSSLPQPIVQRHVAQSLKNKRGARPGLARRVAYHGWPLHAPWGCSNYTFRQEHAGGCSYLPRRGTGASPAPVALCSINVNDHGLTAPASPAPPGTIARTPHTAWSGRATSTSQMTRPRHHEGKLMSSD